MIEKKLRKRSLKEEPALIIAAFGSSTKGKIIYDICDSVIQQELDSYKTVWAYTSEIIRAKNSHPGILEALSLVEAQGYRNVVVQPLHIFPATEYSVLSETCYSFPGMRVIMGETLLHRWVFVHEVLDIIAQDFLSPDEGINIVAAHGTPLCVDPSNAVYLGLNHLLTYYYDNVFFLTIEGIPGSEIIFKKLLAIDKKQKTKVRIIPFMYVAGLHVQEDLLGSEESYKTRLEDIGFSVQWLTVDHNDNNYPKTLGFYEEIPYLFVNRIKRALQLIKYF